MANSELPDILTERSGEVNHLCRKHNVNALFVFGSAVTGRFSESSDLDFLVTFNPELSAIAVAESYFGLKEELEALFCRPVDLVSTASLTNPYFRDSVMEERQSLYAA
ncbi:nucleotidyltransferase domain-containing protein [Marinobacter metalliresistant]|uniref:Nucleotidyltransferase domain-containing protein n=1 Tax=Marinobacter metalliresistant TaxID=2961995 RepID=A0ABZ2W586_9GAMM